MTAPDVPLKNLGTLSAQPWPLLFVEHRLALDRQVHRRYITLCQRRNSDANLRVQPLSHGRAAKKRYIVASTRRGNEAETDILGVGTDTRLAE